MRLAETGHLSRLLPAFLGEAARVIAARLGLGIGVAEEVERCMDDG